MQGFASSVRPLRQFMRGGHYMAGGWPEAEKGVPPFLLAPPPVISSHIKLSPLGSDWLDSIRLPSVERARLMRRAIEAPPAVEEKERGRTGGRTGRVDFDIKGAMCRATWPVGHPDRTGRPACTCISC